MVSRLSRCEREVEDFAVKGERLIDIADIERNLVDADEARLALIGLPFWSVRIAPTI